MHALYAAVSTTTYLWRMIRIWRPSWCLVIWFVN